MLNMGDSAELRAKRKRFYEGVKAIDSLQRKIDKRSRSAASSKSKPFVNEDKPINQLTHRDTCNITALASNVFVSGSVSVNKKDPETNSLPELESTQALLSLIDNYSYVVTTSVDQQWDSNPMLALSLPAFAVGGGCVESEHTTLPQAAVPTVAAVASPTTIHTPNPMLLTTAQLDKLPYLRRIERDILADTEPVKVETAAPDADSMCESVCDSSSGSCLPLGHQHTQESQIRTQLHTPSLAAPLSTPVTTSFGRVRTQIAADVAQFVRGVRVKALSGNCNHNGNTGSNKSSTSRVEPLGSTYLRGEGHTQHQHLEQSRHVSISVQVGINSNSWCVAGTL